MLYMQGTYRLTEATIAIDLTSQPTSFCKVHKGVLVVVDGNSEGNLVEVIHAGRRLLMFEDDLSKRAQPVCPIAIA